MFETVEPETLRDFLQLNVPRNPTITRTWLHVENPVDHLNLPCHTCQSTPEFIVQHELDNMSSYEIDDFLIESQRYCEFSQERLKRIEELKIQLKKQARILNNVQSQNFLYQVQDNQVQNKIDKVHLRMYIHGPYTKELEIWFDKVANSCLGLSDTDRFNALKSIRYDPNVVFMATEFVNFIVSQTHYNAINPNIKNLTYIMKMLKNFLLNEVFSVNSIKEYLHLLIPACITCIVCSTLCRRLEIENLWKLRENLMHFAVKILKLIVDKYSSPINKIQERVLSVFKNAISDSKLELSSIYASLFTLQSMGKNPKTGFEYLTEMESQLDEIDKKVTSITCTFGQMDTHRYHAIKIKNLIFKYRQSKNPAHINNNNYYNNINSTLVSGKGGKTIIKSSTLTIPNNNSAVPTINNHNYSSSVIKNNNSNYNSNNNSNSATSDRKATGSGTGKFENDISYRGLIHPIPSSSHPISLNLIQQQKQR